MPATPLGPESLAWRLGFRRSAMLLAGRALLLQVAHPAVGAGVADFSNFRSDPWRRLERTVGSLLTQLFGGAEAIAEAARLRRLHRPVRGTTDHGVPYRALDPEAFAWVHLANIDTTLRFEQLFGRRLGLAARRELYLDWRRAGLVLGVAPRLLPPDLGGFEAAVATIVERDLEDNPTVRVLLDVLALRGVAAPPTGWLPEPVWAALRPAGALVLRDAAVGTLPPVLRDRLGLRWSAVDRLRLEALASAVRRASTLVPPAVLQYPEGRRAQEEARRYRVGLKSAH